MRPIVRQVRELSVFLSNCVGPVHVPLAKSRRPRPSSRLRDTDRLCPQVYFTSTLHIALCGLSRGYDRNCNHLRNREALA